MTVVALPTRSSLEWAHTGAALHEALEVADHPRLHEHAEYARTLLADAGRPTRAWADRIAAIAVIASRRADLAPTMARRAAYIDVAAAAAQLLLLAELLHGALPDPAALRMLDDLRPGDPLHRTALS